MRSLRPLLALLLVAVALFSWWLAGDPPPPSRPPPPADGERGVDYTIRGLDVTRMTAAGEPAHRLRAASVRHFTDDDTSAFDDPRLQVYQADDPPWDITADSALASADGSVILLSGEVVIERAGDADSAPLRLLTRNLRVQPREDYAETDEPVRVDSESDWLEAVGMQAWLRPPSRLKFLSRVKGHYVPR